MEQKKQHNYNHVRASPCEKIRLASSSPFFVCIGLNSFTVRRSYAAAIEVVHFCQYNRSNTANIAEPKRAPAAPFEHYQKMMPIGSPGSEEHGTQHEIRTEFQGELKKHNFSSYVTNTCDTASGYFEHCDLHSCCGNCLIL